MTIQLPDVGTGVPADKTGDSPWLAMKKVRENFNDPTNAASRLLGTGAEQVPLSKNIPSLLGTAATKNVGTAAGNVMEVGAYGFGGTSFIGAPNAAQQLDSASLLKTFMVAFSDSSIVDYGRGLSWATTYGRVHQLLGGTFNTNLYHVCIADAREAPSQRTISYHKIWTESNATKDSNGFLKGASPVIDMYDNKISLNHDAEQQGDITFEKLGVGDYLVKGSLGFAQEGWYIETPKDANGNVLVAVVYEQLENNDLSIKTYAKRFDDETGDIVANLLKPRDIPTGRFISLRLHELPKEPPVMPDDIQTEV